MERKRFEDLTPDEVRGFVERVVVDAGPAPLSEWPDDVLRQCLFTQSEDSPQYYWNEKGPVYAPEALAELLRRKERETIEQCAKLCEARAVDLITQPADHGRSVATRELWAVAKDIRGLQ